MPTAGKRSCPAERATRLMGKLPYESNVVVWPCPSVPCGLEFPHSAWLMLIRRV
jgi:hypothetical protein